MAAVRLQDRHLLARHPDAPPAQGAAEALTTDRVRGYVAPGFGGVAEAIATCGEGVALDLDIHIGVPRHGLATWYQRLLEGRLPPLVDAPGVTGHDVFVDEEVTWTLAGDRIDGDDIGMGGLGGQWAAARPGDGLAWAFLTTDVGDFDRAQRVEDALLAALA